MFKLPWQKDEACECDCELLKELEVLAEIEEVDVDELLLCAEAQEFI